MQNSFIKKVFWIVVLIGIFYGIYMILPPVPHAIIKSYCQPYIEKDSTIKITNIKNTTNETIGKTYQEILEKNANIPTWVYDKPTESSKEKVTFFGSGYVIDLREIPEYNGAFYSGSTIKVEFIKNNTTKQETLNIKIYINGSKTPCDEKFNDEILKAIMNG